jgi:hypothetical protein
MYWCRSIVSINRVPEGKTYYDPPCPDWGLIVEHRIEDEALIKAWGRHESLNLRPDVTKWLYENIKDRSGEEQHRGWCVGDEEYRSKDGISFSIFFHRPSDALRFVKHWSVYKNPLEHYNYFKSVLKKLDTKTGRMKTITR